jgi:hypothetical protein
VKFNFIELIRSAFVKRDQKFRQRLTVFFICLLIAVFVWFTVKMENEYQEVIPIPLKYTIAPRSQVLVEASDSVIYVELNERGSELLRYRFTKSQDPLEVSTKNVILTQRENYSKGYILTSSLMDDLGYQLDLAGRIVSVSPDTIYLSFKNETTKRVAVTAKMEIKTQKQYMVYGPVIFEPDTVLIKGPEDLLSQIATVSLGTIAYDNLDKTTTRSITVPLTEKNKYITAKPDQVNVTIPVEKFTEATVKVPITPLSDSNLRIRLFPDVVELNCRVALKDYTQLTPGMFLAIADFNSVDLDTEKEVRVKLTEYPSTIIINRIEPEKAEFIIIK